MRVGGVPVRLLRRPPGSTPSGAAQSSTAASSASGGLVRAPQPRSPTGPLGTASWRGIRWIVIVSSCGTRLRQLCDVALRRRGRRRLVGRRGHSSDHFAGRRSTSSVACHGARRLIVVPARLPRELLAWLGGDDPGRSPSATACFLRHPNTRSTPSLPRAPPSPSPRQVLADQARRSPATPRAPRTKRSGRPHSLGSSRHRPRDDQTASALPGGAPAPTRLRSCRRRVSRTTGRARPPTHVPSQGCSTRACDSSRRSSMPRRLSATAGCAHAGTCS